MARIIEFSVTVDNVRISPLGFPNIILSGSFNSVNFSIATVNSWIVDKIDSEGYVKCKIVIDGDEYNFILDSVSMQDEFGESKIQLEGLSQTALVDARFSQTLPELEFNSASELISLLNNEISLLGLSITGSFFFEITQLEISTLEKTTIDVLKDLSEIVNMDLITEMNGKVFRFIPQPYTESGITGAVTLVDKFTEIITLGTNVSDATQYNVVEVIGAGEEGIGTLILETEEDEGTPGTYLLSVWSEPNINTFSSVIVETTDGLIALVTAGKVINETETVDFSGNKASLSHPFYSSASVTWYSDVNSIETTVGSREVAVTNSDDMAIAEVVYNSICNVYRLSRLTEPIVKIKVTAES